MTSLADIRPGERSLTSGAFATLLLTVVGTFLFIVIPGFALKGMLRVEIEQVRIASSHRGKGLGRQMIGWAIAEAQRIGAGMVQLAMNKSRTDSHRFYESLGFTASHEGFKLYL